MEKDGLVTHGDCFIMCANVKSPRSTPETSSISTIFQLFFKKHVVSQFESRLYCSVSVYTSVHIYIWELLLMAPGRAG